MDGGRGLQRNDYQWAEMQVGCKSKKLSASDDTADSDDDVLGDNNDSWFLLLRSVDGFVFMA